MPKEILGTNEKMISSRIYAIRNKQVMLDRDLAELYGVKAIRLREQVKRNSKRFPDDFMYQLTEDEANFLVSQNAIPSKKSLGGFLPYVFTEQGVANLSSVLTSEKAIEVNICIMRAFVAMRKCIQTNALLFQRMDVLEQKQMIYQADTNNKFDKVFRALESGELSPKQGIFFDGQIFDGYTFVVDLIKKARTSLIVIDNYVDESVLTMLSKRKKGVTATILSKNISKQLKLDLEKHNAQYAAIKIEKFSQAHDRFVIIDKKDIYHIGASLKDLGKKWFAFSKLEKDAVRILEKLT